MTRGLRRFIKANNFPWSIFKSYWKNSSKSEVTVDIFFPVLFSIGLLLITFNYIDNFSTMISKYQQLSGQLIAAIAVLAGFNIASITIISSANTQTNLLRNTPSETNPNMSVFEVLIAFFTWAVIVQLFVVLVGIILFYITSLIPSEIHTQIPIWAWACAGLLLTVIMHSMFISIRNMKTLYLYVTYVEPTSKNSSNT
jgi:sensor histidine kinase YesM